MYRTLRSLIGLAALIAAGAALGHEGLVAHSHPHPDWDTIILLIAGGAAVGILLYVRRGK